MSVRFVVDLEELQDSVGRMTRFQQHLDASLARLDATVAGLHDTWVGESALAQRAAHQQWRHGARSMHDALAEMSRAAQHAHDCYLRATEANMSMWGGLA